MLGLVEMNLTFKHVLLILVLVLLESRESNIKEQDSINRRGIYAVFDFWLF